MKYKNEVVKAEFVSRPNRFVAVVKINGKEEFVHVKNTGRCKELLIPGVSVFAEKQDGSGRKTGYDIICVEKKERLINIDSLAPNKVVFEWLSNGGLLENPTLIQSEKTYKNSRFDFYAEKDERKIFIEVKGVTLEENGVVMFPDAPTKRGVKHLCELCDCVKNGYEAYIIFVVQMKGADYFTPNAITDKDFATELKNCQKNGVNILCFDCHVTPDSLEIAQRVKVVLQEEN